ncbi:GtrA family protein [Phyllobacterium chamaecytisi]|uniref:GtrA family protein n=1 Tax=Phyllobacterium chamaecytisi TaxID=2876082 RepID=UPI001CCC315D|nr:GtrA family protein [Phyllobacterium sp. KW56]MBZ9601972.1 GtrA family protein [Phyllobacterium sp. KW56]
MERLDLASRFTLRLQQQKSAVGRQSVGQLLRYGLVGVITNFLGYILYLSITFFGVGPKTTMTVLYFIGTSISFVGNRKWVFSHQGNVFDAGLRYVAAYATGYLLNYSILFVFVDLYGYPHAYVQAVSIAVVAAYLFAVLKFLVFPHVRAHDGIVG